MLTRQFRHKSEYQIFRPLASRRYEILQVYWAYVKEF